MYFILSFFLVGFGYFLGLVFGKPFETHNHDTDHKSKIIHEESRLQLRGEKGELKYDYGSHTCFSLGTNDHYYLSI